MQQAITKDPLSTGVDSKPAQGTTRSTDEHAGVTTGAKGPEKGKKGWHNKGNKKGRAKQQSQTQGSSDSMARLEEELRKPVDIKDLAARYGLEYDRIKKLADTEDEVGEDKKAMREARRNVNVLQAIKKYLETTRATIRLQGNRVHMVLYRLPGSLLTVEEKRCESLFRTGHRLAHNYTRHMGQAIYRCPIPGCGGATINSSSIARSTPVHFRAFHREIEAIFIIRIELRNGWDHIQVPDQGKGVWWGGDAPADEDPKEKVPSSKGYEQQGRTCAMMQPYMGKKSIPQATVEQELQRQKEGKASRKSDHWVNWAMPHSEGQQRLSCEAMASKGVYQINPGPRGSGISEVRTPAEGKATRPSQEEEIMTKDEFEVQLLTG